MQEDKNTGQITERLHHVFVVVFLTPLAPNVAHEIQLRIQERSLQPIAIVEGILYAFDTHEKLRQWQDGVGGLLAAARIRYIQARLVDPVFGYCTKEEERSVVGLGLSSYCVIVPNISAETKQPSKDG